MNQFVAGDKPGVISVIIAAHNESRSLAVGLPLLLDGCASGELEVLVVANGCSDNTVAVAASFGSPVRVLTTTEASKIAALNLGDRAATGYPRFYVDADVEISLSTLRRVADVLREGRYLAAAPALRVDTTNSSLLVRSFCRFWCQLPEVATDLAGRGVYAISEAGHCRFDSFPDVIADDYFIRSIYKRSERISVDDCESVVRAPRTVAALLRRRVRVLAGNRQLDERFLIKRTSLPKKATSLFNLIRSHPRLVIDLPSYALIAAAARVIARFRNADGPIDLGRNDSR